jgi:hypothetical protein
MDIGIPSAFANAEICPGKWNFGNSFLNAGYFMINWFKCFAAPSTAPSGSEDGYHEYHTGSSLQMFGHAASTGLLLVRKL